MIFIFLTSKSLPMGLQFIANLLIQVSTYAYLVLQPTSFKYFCIFFSKKALLKPTEKFTSKRFPAILKKEIRG